MAKLQGALSGVKVVACSTAQAGTVPYSLMADLGAEVIKIELSDATINFKENKNEISKRSVGGEPHKERPTDEATDSEE